MKSKLKLNKDNSYKHNTEDSLISYKTENIIKIFDIDKNTQIQYIIKTFLSIMFVFDDCEVHIVKKVK